MPLAGAVLVLHEALERLQPHAETSHTEHCLTFVLNGRLRFEHGAETSVGAGSMVIVPAGVPHRLLGGRDLEYWWLGFCTSCLDLSEGHLLMSPFRRVRHGGLPVVVLPKGQRRRVVRLYRELEEEQRRGAPESHELMRCLLLLLLGVVHRALPSAPVAPESSLVGEVLEVIQRRCFEPISLRDVAKAVHRSAAHVTTVVRQATGHSVGAWIAAARVAEAAKRLVHTDESLDAIAGRVGWRDKTHFIRQFRKAYGITPAAFRRGRRAAHARAAASTPAVDWR